MTEFFNKPEYTQRRKELRNNPTKTEKQLWCILKTKNLMDINSEGSMGLVSMLLIFIV